MAANDDAPGDQSSPGRESIDAENAGSGEHDARSLSRFVAADPVRDLGLDVDPVAYWSKQRADSAERLATAVATIEEALRMPIAPGDLCMQLVGGRGDGMRLIRQMIALSLMALH